MSNLRTIDFSKKYFECDGSKFFVEDTLSFERYQKLEEFSLEFGFSASFADIFKVLRKIWDNHNKLNFADNAVLLHNLMKGIVDLEQKKSPVSLRICALFINEENEDRTEYNEAKMQSKIDRWGKELDINPFFHLAVSLVQGYLSAYEITLRAISERAAEVKGASKPK